MIYRIPHFRINVWETVVEVSFVFFRVQLKRLVKHKGIKDMTQEELRKYAHYNYMMNVTNRGYRPYTGVAVDNPIPQGTMFTIVHADGTKQYLDSIRLVPSQVRDGDVVQMMEDYLVDETIYFTSWKSFVLDLGGHKITLGGSDTEPFKIFNPGPDGGENDITVTLRNGSYAIQSPVSRGAAIEGNKYWDGSEDKKIDTTKAVKSVTLMIDNVVCESGNATNPYYGGHKGTVKINGGGISGDITFGTCSWGDTYANSLWEKKIEFSDADIKVNGLTLYQHEAKIENTHFDTYSATEFVIEIGSGWSNYDDVLNSNLDICDGAVFEKKLILKGFVMGGTKFESKVNIRGGLFKGGLDITYMMNKGSYVPSEALVTITGGKFGNDISELGDKISIPETHEIVYDGEYWEVKAK